jgi:hypothetical protein
MSTEILSQDIVSIMLLLAEGDINMTLTELFKCIEEYEERNNCHFGISRGDFIFSIQVFMMWELHLSDVLHHEQNIKLKEIIPDVLRFHSACFKDTEDYWLKEDVFNKRESLYFTHYTEKEYETKIILKNLIKEFFHYSETIHTSKESVIKFLIDNNITIKILEDCSRPGENN